MTSSNEFPGGEGGGAIPVSAVHGHFRMSTKRNARRVEQQAKMGRQPISTSTKATKLLLDASTRLVQRVAHHLNPPPPHVTYTNPLKQAHCRFRRLVMTRLPHPGTHTHSFNSVHLKTVSTELSHQTAAHASIAHAKLAKRTDHQHMLSAQLWFRNHQTALQQPLSFL